MSPTTSPGQAIRVPSVPNLRDVGGYATAEGRRVRTGVLYRSVALDRVRPEDEAALAGLGIRTVFDLRTRGERTSAPDRLPPGAEPVVCDVLADAAGLEPAQMEALFTDPAGAAHALGDGRAAALMEKAYREFIGLPSARSAYRTYFLAMADEARRPALVHCTTGKDRTGWAVAATLLLLGVAEADVRADYLATNRDLVPALQPVFDRFAAAGGDPEVLRPILGVDERYLDAALGEMRRAHGTVERYVADGLGIDHGTLAALREALTEP